MSLEKRTREWIHKPVFNGAPVSWAQRYFQYRLQYYRDEHKEFDTFLNEIGELLKNENDEIYNNLKRFIAGNSETNWISASNVMFDGFIKLYNLCLSPKQAFDYIKECAKHYKQLLENKYELGDNIGFSIIESRYDGKLRKSVNVMMLPVKELDNDKHFWFNVTFSSVVVTDKVNDVCSYPDIDVEACRSEDITKDTMMLFERYQNKDLSRIVFNQALEQLIKRGVVELQSIEEKSWGIVRNYKINDNILGKSDNRDFRCID